MGGQVLGGGVIVMVAVVLWLVYLLPSWHSRHQYASAERNAVRLNQAIRVLAETSETPRDVHLELTARTALAQQRLARRAQEQREQAELAIARARLEVEREQGEAEREAARAELAAARELAQARRAASRALPAARRARARRAVRLTATVVALVAAGVGVWQVAVGASAALVWAGTSVVVVCGIALRRMSRVAARSVDRTAAAPAVRAATALQDLALSEPRSAAWTPRELPRPLASSAGSRAAAVLDGQAAREALRTVAREQTMRELAEKQAPPSIDTARVAKQSEFSRMGYVDDAEIEAHVRHLLERRASGQ